MRIKSFYQYLIFICFFIFIHQKMNSQNPFSLNGYVTEMPSYSWMNFAGVKMDFKDNLIHNRLNFSYTPSSKLFLAAEFRNRFICGETMKMIPDYADNLNKDNGLMDLSFNVVSGKNYVLNVMLDRLWAEYILGSFQIRVGRQRINWGQSMVWNPNDIFNAYSYFDFDYLEKPGIDGLRLQYYTGNASLIEGVMKLDHNNILTAAGRYRFNVVGYDFQFLGGWFNDKEWMLGAGWSGDVMDAGFYGECSWFIPKDKDLDQSLISSVGANYTFSNSLFIQGEILYSSNLKNPGDFFDFYYKQSDVKSLSLTEWTWFASASYPVTPLLNASFSIMGFPDINSYYLGPGIDYSLLNNLTASLILQYFGGTPNNTKSESIFGFFRLKYNF